MEYLSGTIKLRDIFLDNGNWWRLFLKRRHLIRIAIIINVVKMLTCRTSALGFHRFFCPSCGEQRTAPHTCKSRFCSSCGKKATDQWIAKAKSWLPATTWQHITFTLPRELQNIIWANRHLMGKIAKQAAEIILDQAKKKHFIPGIYLAIHTFGRDLKRNFHIHLSTTVGGLSEDKSRWINRAYFHHGILKKLWKYAILETIRSEYNAGKLRLPQPIAHLANGISFNNLLNSLWQKTWVVHLNKQSMNQKVNIHYLGKYLKRPPLAETRIKAYDGVSVTFKYLDHYTGEISEMTLSSEEFLERLIAHIPDENFRNIRYYGFLSNRTSGKLLPVVYKLLGQIMERTKQLTWRSLVQATAGVDPIRCPRCGSIMTLLDAEAPVPISQLIKKHEEIANAAFQMV